MDPTRVKIVKNNTSVRIPERATDGSAGYDLYAPEDCIIDPGTSKLLSLGFGMEINQANVCAKIYSRSGLTGQGITVAGAPTIIDPDYQGVIKVRIHNGSEHAYEIQKGNRVAQMMFEPFHVTEWTEAEKFARRSTRGEGGFGSTGQ